MVQSVEKEEKNKNNRSEIQHEVGSDLDRKFIEKKIVSTNWLTTKEAAEYLRTSPNQIRNWVYQGKVKHYKLFNKSLRFKLNELDLLHQGGQVWE